ncbi:MAG: hypothetical protein ACRECN_08650, partial [Methylocella sp.]
MKIHFDRFLAVEELDAHDADHGRAPAAMPFPTPTKVSLIFPAAWSLTSCQIASHACLGEAPGALHEKALPQVKPPR